MNTGFLVLIMLLTVVTSTQAEGRRALFHATKVKHPETTEGETPAPGQFEMEYKVWGYTKTTEYVLSCTEIWKVDNGTSKIEIPCAPMSAGSTYEVKVFSKAILYPADQPNQPTYGWYMIREEQERPSRKHQ
jgi:hypothetical protein